MRLLATFVVLGGLAFAQSGSNTQLAIRPGTLDPNEQRIVKEVQRVRPERLVIDALSELRMLAKDPLRYRRQILSLKDFMADQECTVILLDDRSSREPDLQLHSVVHGVISSLAESTQMPSSAA